MGQEKYLIDTNAIIDYLGRKIPENGMSFMNDVMDSIPIVSVISKIEILGFKTTDKNYSILSDFMNDAIVLNLSDDVVNWTISLRKSVNIKLPDAIIAATAIAHNLSLITRNLNDFKKITNLQLVDPYVLLK
jgi:predicted nucleic acid-binding protein